MSIEGGVSTGNDKVSIIKHKKKHGYNEKKFFFFFETQDFPSVLASTCDMSKTIFKNFPMS